MNYIVRADTLSEISLSESDPVRSVIQNIAVILTTRKGTVPLQRDFGLDMTMLDRPMPVARAMLYSEVRDALEIWEPRAKLMDVSFETTNTAGALIPVVEVEIIAE